MYNNDLIRLSKVVSVDKNMFEDVVWIKPIIPFIYNTVSAANHIQPTILLLPNF